MNVKLFILIMYMLIGFLLIIFNKQITNLNYKLVLFFTDKLKLKDFFLFKIDYSNKDSMRFLTRSFTIILGFMIFFISFYLLKNNI